MLGKFHGQRSGADYSPWGHKESDTPGHTQVQKVDSVRLFNCDVRNAIQSSPKLKRVPCGIHRDYDLIPIPSVAV